MIFQLIGIGFQEWRGMDSGRWKKSHKETLSEIGVLCVHSKLSAAGFIHAEQCDMRSLNSLIWNKTMRHFSKKRYMLPESLFSGHHTISFFSLDNSIWNNFWLWFPRSFSAFFHFSIHLKASTFLAIDFLQCSFLNIMWNSPWALLRWYVPFIDRVRQRGEKH